MPETPLAEAFLRALAQAGAQSEPYPHWLLCDVLPEPMLRSLASLPVPAPALGETMGRRETHNATRWFFGAAAQRDFAPCRELAQCLQAPRVARALEARCAADLRGSFLRIEYCRDADGFWLEPHTDIGAKRFTMLIYLCDSPPSEDWGTDIYAAPEQHHGTAPFGANRGLVFIPGDATWHGFRRRRITGLRRSLIVNYVTPDWRARHELAYADMPVA